MISKNLSELLGIGYEALDEEGSIGFVDTPFTFENGDPIPVYVEKIDHSIRFFDDGEVIWHLMGRGIPLDKKGDADFIRALIEPCGAALNKKGEIETWAETVEAPLAFARYLSAILAIVRWEKEKSTIEDERRRHEIAADAKNLSALSA